MVVVVAVIAIPDSVVSAAILLMLEVMIVVQVMLLLFSFQLFLMLVSGYPYVLMGGPSAVVVITTLCSLL